MKSLFRALAVLTLGAAVFVLPAAFDARHVVESYVAAAPVLTKTEAADPPTLTLPAKKTAKANRYFCIRATTNCTSIKWIVPSGLEQLDPEIQIKDKFAIVLIGEDGTYTVQAIGTLNDVLTDFASCEVTIGTPPPPKPPTPPTPTDPLTAALQAGYNLDADADKAKSLEFLQSVFSGMVGLVPTWTTVKTNSQALAQIKAVVDAPGVGLKTGQVANLRKAIGAELAATFGTAPNTPIDLTSLATEIGKVAKSLQGVH